MTSAAIAARGMTSAAIAARGEAALETKSVAFMRRLTFTALVAAEEELRPPFALVERAAAGDLKLCEMAALFWHCSGNAVMALNPAYSVTRFATRWPRPDWRRRHRFEGVARAVTFADNAMQLCGQCALLFGWRSDEFWKATPAEPTCILHAVTRRNRCAVKSSALDRSSYKLIFNAPRQL